MNIQKQIVRRPESYRDSIFIGNRKFQASKRVELFWVLSAKLKPNTKYEAAKKKNNIAENPKKCVFFELLISSNYVRAPLLMTLSYFYE